MPDPVARPAAAPRARRAGMLTMLGRPRTLWRFLRDRNAPTLPRVLAVLALLYVVFPIDAIPDFAPVIGWIDDLGIASMVIAYVAASAARHEAARGELTGSTVEAPQRTAGTP